MRRRERQDALTNRLRNEAQEAAEVPFRGGLPDRRLELMFVCAHPDLPASVRAPLILQTVLGLTAERIAGVMMLKPSVLSQRLVRAKRLIKEARLPFQRPPPEELEARLADVLDAIYAAYGTGWAVTGDAAALRSGLAHEALWLARLLVGLLPEAAEAKGLYALLLHCEARREARRDGEGRFVPLEAQDPSRWDRGLLVEAEKALWMAAKLRQPGIYQLEAAIQSLHADRARTGTVDWAKIQTLYRMVMEQSPSVGATLGYAATFGRLGRPQEGLTLLDELDAGKVAHHQPYWAVRAHLLAEAGQPSEADTAYARAIGLTGDEAVRGWLISRRAEAKKRGGHPPGG